MDPLRVALRTYTLSLSLSLVPSVLPVLTSPKARSPKKIYEILRRELNPTGFAFAMTLAIAGGRALDQLWTTLDRRFTPYNESKSHSERRTSNLSPSQRTFLANTLSSSIAVMLLTFRRRSHHIPTASIPLTVPTPPQRGSPTLDLTLLLFVRALDVGAQTVTRRWRAHKMDGRTDAESDKSNKKWRSRSVSVDLDAFVFWLACSRIMWCFFYQPERLPKSYVKWITSLADMDSRLLIALRAIREGTWKYTRPSPTHNTLLTSMAADLQLNPLWGDPRYLPAYGGSEAHRAWEALGVKGRGCIGGIPCDVVHCGIAGNSCTGNALKRGIRAFGQALLIYAPVHVLPALLSNPTQILIDPLPILGALFRSASFLSTFVSSIWFTVCFVRTLFVARFFPRISHNVLDGPQGCILAGCLVCGASIGLEKGKRRGEMALYVLPRAIRACLPETWVKSDHWSARGSERLVFVLSLASILTSAIHEPDSLRGLSRWAVAYVMSGTSSGFWKKRRQSHLPTTDKGTVHPEWSPTYTEEGGHI